MQLGILSFRTSHIIQLIQIYNNKYLKHFYWHIEINKSYMVINYSALHFVLSKIVGGYF